MPTSWLAKAKSIHDLGGYFVVQKPGRYDEEKDLRAERKWRQKWEEPIPVAPEFRVFYGSRMHDSWVMGIERKPDVLGVRLDCINADIFALNLVAVRDIERLPSQWPVDLLLHDPRYVRAARHDPEGNLRFIDWKAIHSEAPQEGTNFLYDWFFQQEGRLQWIAHLWDWRDSTHKLSNSALLMVDCARATAVDHRANAIERAYGPGARLLWEDALANFHGQWGIGALEGFIIDRIAERRLTKGHFIPRK